MFMFTVTTKVLNKRSVVPHPSVPFHCGRAPLCLSLFCLPLKCGSDKSWKQPVCPLSHRDPGNLAQSNGPLYFLDSKVVSSPAFITNERWVILSRENARMPWSGQSSVGRVESIPFKFRIPYACRRVIHIRHLEEVFGASILMHFNSFSAPFLWARVLRVLSIWGHLKIPTFEDEFAYVIFILSAAGNNQCNA